MKKNIAVVGAGYWGRNLVRNFGNLKALHTVCDSDLNLYFILDGVENSPDYREVLSNPEIKGVVIATPASMHYKMAKQALFYGKDVFIEKPMALSSVEGAELVVIAEKQGRIILVGHVLEYHPAIRKLQEMVESGKLGNLRYIYSNRLNLGRFRTEENILWSFAPHDIAVMLSLTGNMPTSVIAQGATYINAGIADVTVTGLTFPNNIRGHIFVSWLHPFKEQKLVVIGDKGMVVFNDMVEDKLVFFNSKVGWDNNMPVPEVGIPEVIEIASDEPLKLECIDFIKAMKERRSPFVDGKKGVQVLEVLEMCQKAMKEAE